MSAVTPERFAERFPRVAAPLEGGELEALLASLELHDADAGEALVAEETQSSDLFLVWDGALDVTLRGAAGERTLAPVGPGDVFGEVSLLDPGPATATVVTEQGCVTLRLSRERLDALRADNPAAAAALLREVVASLGARLRRARRSPEEAA
jgi:CRP/FNR family cyclic AMP-dependent transcriptional regulator